MGPGDLAQVLRPVKELFRESDNPHLLVGLGRADDAAVYRLDDSRAIIQTIDFFPPVVDDPHDYGAIAAANAMSDIYAMGGEVLFALNVAAFPKSLGREIIGQILLGGAQKVQEAGGVIAGGHTIDDEEPKYGLTVTGIVHPQRILTKGAAHAGDSLVLTKRLGVGLITTVLKAGLAEPAQVQAAVESMLRLNRDASQAAGSAGIRAATDITGFSLLGHALEMAELSGVAFHFSFDDLPLLDGARQYAEEWLFPAGSNNNQAFFAERVTFSQRISEEEQLLLFTPETSGGLLLSVPPEQMDRFFRECQDRDQPAWVVGHVAVGQGVTVS